MRIAYIVPEFPGQTHAFFWREIAQLTGMGVDLRLVSTRPPKRKLVSHMWAGKAARRTEYLASPSVSLVAGIWEILRRPSVLREIFSPKELALLVCAGRLARRARRERLTHFHAHSCGNSAIIARLASKITGMPYSISLHGPLWAYGDRQNEKFGGADFALTITEELRKSIRDELNGDAPLKIGIAPMGVDTEKFRRSAPFVPWRGGKLRLFCCARLTPWKGYEELIQSLRTLCERGLEAHLTIAGEDDAGGSGYRARIEDMAAGLPVKFLGAVSEERVVEELERAHIFVLPSHSEPLGVAIMEAMACGVPVVSTNTGGVPHLIDDGVNGLLVPPKNPAALSNTIERLARDASLQVAFSKLGRGKIEAEFTSEVGARELYRMLDSSHNAYPFQ